MAANPVVILYDGMPKQEMTDMINDAFSERCIKQKRTKVGRDVIFRVGDPTSAHDLVRVGAHEATSILIM